jgi:uncharacterized protein YukE
VAGPGYLSDSAAMTQAIQAFDQCAQDAQQAMRNLEQELNSTLGNNYQGLQASAFWNLHTEIQQQMSTASKEIDTMSNLVSQAFKNYQSGDSQAADTMKQVASSANSTSSTLQRLGAV